MPGLTIRLTKSWTPPAINPFIDGISAFKERETRALAVAYEEICEAMQLPPDATGHRLVVTTRVDLTQTGMIEARTIRERVLIEAKNTL